MQSEPNAEPKPSLPPLKVLVAVALLALTLRMVLAWQSTDKLLVFCLPDDAYYYFEIARNIVAGSGVSFDGVTPTNGFHPLWLAMILPLFAAFADPDVPIHLSLSLGAVLDSVTVVLIGLLAWRIIRRGDWAIIFALLYALNPYAVHASINGLETAVSLLMIALFTLQYLRIRDLPAVAAGDLALLGLLGGLLLVARTDNVFLWALVGLALLWALPGARKPAFVGLYAAGAALVLAPWLIWNLLTFGSIVQVSGVAVPYMVKQVIMAERGVTGIVAPGLVKDLMKWTVANWKAALSMAMPPVIVVPLVFFAMGAYTCGWDSRRRERFLWLAARLWPIIIAAAMLVAYHVMGRWYEHIREWYAVSTVPAGLLLLCGVVAMLRELKSGGWLQAWPRLIVVPLVIVVLLGLGYKAQKLLLWERYPWQASYKQVALWANENTPSDAVLGAFNAGIIGYWADRTVYNLDGAVNNEVYPHIISGQIGRFVHERGIEYLVDHPHEYTERKKLRFWGEYPLPTIDGQLLQRVDNSTAGYDDMAVYRMPLGQDRNAGEDGG